jgi:hypothetical protein
MAKPDLSKLSGQNLFEYYVSRGGEYSSVLNQAFSEIGHDLFTMLKTCERTGRRISITEDLEGVIDSPVTVAIG